jgi:sterol desaturase/sphingolipid hydroxylase (fatty acid hydroxylase superfamily)
VSFRPSDTRRPVSSRSSAKRGPGEFSHAPHERKVQSSPTPRGALTPAWLQCALAGLGLALVAIELARPLRRRQRESKARHLSRNAAIAGLAAATVQLLEQPVVRPLARLAQRRGWGLLGRSGLPDPARTVLALLALDYTLYLWHILVHRVPALWRFHAVHHADLDLDASTAIRFHFGELALSVPWRAAQVVVIGVDARTLALWQTLTLMSVLFHHSNVRLPERLESALGAVLVTPRMHGIHHSREADEMQANWSSGLSLWDRLHGTLRTDVPQEAIEIGVDGFDAPSEVRLAEMVRAPFLN